MKFSPKTEKEVAEAGLFAPGTYGFQVVKSEDKLSKNGNEMIQLYLRVFNSEGGFVMVTDYLMEALAYKLRHCAAACGLIEKYEAGELAAADFEDATGHLKLKIEKDKTGQYPDKNAVQDYVADAPAPKITAHNEAKGNAYVNDPAKQGPINDDIPW